MPEVIRTTVYTFGELDGRARERARDWYRQVSIQDDWYEFVFEDFEHVCTIIGVDLLTKPVRLMGGGTRSKPCIWFSGFSSQGDGACFEGRYSYRKGASRAIRAYAPRDKRLAAIADELQQIQRKNFYALEARIAHRGRYYHEHSMEISVERNSDRYQPPTSGADAALCEALRDLARWLYRQLEREHDYQLSNEVVDEAIAANGYTFTECGGRFG
ncbi:MAG: antitoxin of toxin-antitoxin stability system [Cupriavidus sp.]|nr:antitoxin of toxin-antitoxin stability system [Cupriavidus sp.]MCA3704332.1 antitoxin of toxin-antitoxin stability system [Methylobacterium sp.]